MKFNFEDWIKKFGSDDLTIKVGKMQEKYHNEPVIDIMKELKPETIEIIRKLGIKIEDKIYTEYEFDILEGEVFEFYIYEGMSEEDKSHVKSLEGTGVSQEEVNAVIHEIYSISENHNF